MCGRRAALPKTRRPSPRGCVPSARGGLFSLRPVINATGVVLHTNLGRALLSDAAIARVAAVAAAYSNLELDLETKERGSRYAHVDGLLRRLTGAEDALVVNNNAAAVLLALESLARGREVVVSRGELIEIGGEFRIPDIMLRSGARLREVGTTNRTHLRDYAEAIGPDTALLLKVHTSNYRVVGFTAAVASRELAQLGRERGVPRHGGSGLGLARSTCAPTGFPTSPRCPTSWPPGVDLVSFSGDKLLGGPQAGIIVGRHALVSRLKKNPLNRALRIDKLTVAALEATLTSYEAGDALQTVPTLQRLTEPLAAVRARARRLLARLDPALRRQLQARLVPATSQVGGGALPTVELPTVAVAIGADGAHTRELDTALRSGHPPVIGRVVDDRLLLDCRTVLPSEIPPLALALAHAADPLMGAHHVVVGTAGHIDHGKTSLVKALTGIDTDRLPEEKARGITIDLGFAFLEEPGDLTIEIVDVPGHERFVKNMLAGVGGIDLALLVVAADEGVMPQTREHLAICSLLRIRAGLIALTKVDMVEGDWLELVTDDVSRLVRGTFLESAPVLPVSSKTGQGLGELRAALGALAATVPGRATDQLAPSSHRSRLHHQGLRDGGDGHADGGAAPGR